MNVKGVPHAVQNERDRPAQNTIRGSPCANSTFYTGRVFAGIFFLARQNPSNYAVSHPQNPGFRL